MSQQGDAGNDQRLQKVRVVSHGLFDRAGAMAARHEAAITKPRVDLTGAIDKLPGQFDLGEQCLCHAQSIAAGMWHQDAREKDHLACDG